MNCREEEKHHSINHALHIQLREGCDPVMVAFWYGSVYDLCSAGAPLLSEATKSRQLTVCAAQGDQTQQLPAVVMAGNGLTGAA